MAAVGKERGEEPSWKRDAAADTTLQFYRPLISTLIYTRATAFLLSSYPMLLYHLVLWVVHKISRFLRTKNAILPAVERSSAPHPKSRGYFEGHEAKAAYLRL